MAYSLTSTGTYLGQSRAFLSLILRSSNVSEPAARGTEHWGESRELHSDDLVPNEHFFPLYYLTR